jgi:hypothetical protein
MTTKLPFRTSVAWADWDLQAYPVDFGVAAIGLPAQGESHTASIMSPIFQNLFSQYDRYVRLIGNDIDVPWWHRERTLVSDLVAATWATDMIASAEFATERPEGSGWADFWCRSHRPTQMDVYAEAKCCEVRYAGGWSHVYGQLDRCERTQTASACGEECGLTLCFARIQYTMYQATKAGNDWWLEWLGDQTGEAVSRLRTSYFACYLLRRDKWDTCISSRSGCKGYAYPGVFVLAKEFAISEKC